MRATPELVNVLRKTARLIETEKFKWTDSNCCTCGMMIRALNDWSEKDLDFQRVSMQDKMAVFMISPSTSTTWTTQFKQIPQFCSATGITLFEIFRQLKEIGIDTSYDVKMIEFAGCHESEFEKYTDPYYVIKFLNELADELETEMKLL